MIEIKCVIAAAGKGTRSRLNYPKTLYKIDGKSILSRQLSVLKKFDNRPTLIVSNSGKELIDCELNREGYDCETLIQKNQIGMGNALLQVKKSEYYTKSKNFLLVWGDIPFLRSKLLKVLVASHLQSNSEFSFISGYTNNPYTIVVRNHEDEVISLEETHKSFQEFDNKHKRKGERDIGVFLFKKSVIDLLEKDLDGKFNIDGEHGFLYIVKHLFDLGRKVIALPIANQKSDFIGFNSLEDLE